jgi:hypothetical protein
VDPLVSLAPIDGRQSRQLSLPFPDHLLHHIGVHTAILVASVCVNEWQK